jgi:tetratricopeptide (TPR) repeat protein
MSQCLRHVLLAALLTYPALSQTVPEKSPEPAIASKATDPLNDALHLLRTGKFDAALQAYQRILQQQPKSVDAYVGIIRSYLKMGKVDEAQQALNKAKDAVVSSSLQVAEGEADFRQGKIADAEKLWANVINSGNAEPRAYLGLARVRRAIGMHRTAKGMIDRAHALDPQDPDIQRFWIGTLNREARIKYLELYLAGKNDEDAEGHTDTQSYIDYLKAREKEPDRRCHLATKVTSTETPLVPLLLDPQHLRSYALTVELNDHKTKLLLDTGATGLLVDRRVAEKAGITKISDSKVGGVGDKGNADSYIGYADSIKIGELEFRDCRVEVLDKRSVMGDDGLIGADVFEDFLVDIDFPNQKLKLTPLPQPPDAPKPEIVLETNSGDSGQHSESKQASSSGTDDPASTDIQFQDRYISPEMNGYSQVFRFGHELLVPTKIGGTTRKLFLLDTGAFNNAISPAAAREVTKVHGDSDTIIEGLSGSVKRVYSADKLTLEFGHLKQANEDMTSWDLTKLSEDDGTEVSGFLGFVMLHMLDIKIDYRDDLVDFEFDAEKYR